MTLGKIIGKTSTNGFKFLVEGNARKFDYVKVKILETSTEEQKTHEVLCQIIDLEREENVIIAKCNSIGYKDEKIKQPRVAFIPGTDVKKAENEFIKQIIEIETKEGAFIGKLDGKNIDIFINLGKMLNKHVSILAKSGAGKSYTTGVLIEEIMEKKVPLLIIDPHGEYAQMKYPNDDKKDEISLKKFKVKPKSFIREIREYGDPRINSDAKQLFLSDKFDLQELGNILPGKLSANQMACVYGAMKDSDGNLDSLSTALEFQESNAKWGLIDNIDYLKKLNIFSTVPTNYEELISPGKCSIINLKGTDPEVGEIIVYKLLKDLFQARKRNIIPPFFAVIEEAHNFAPERSFGETKCSKILRTIASEGRKFGLGLCIVSQRPARVDKSVLSQCSTQIILKMTNPHDLKAVSGAVEGITSEAEAEIKNLPIGTALLTGIVEIPLFVNIRPRKTKHGGVSVEMIQDTKEEENFMDQLENYADEKVEAIILPKINKKDIMLMSEKKIKEIKTYAVPSILLYCEKDNQEFNILVELTQGKIITDPESNNPSNIIDLTTLSESQKTFLEEIKKLTEINTSNIMKETKRNFTEIQTLLKKLEDEEIIIGTKEKYLINPSIDIKTKQFLGKIQYSKLNTTKELQKNIDVKEIIKKIKLLTKIKDKKECKIVWYEPVFEEEENE